MADVFESGALLGHQYRLADGCCVRLRLARGSDAPAVKALLERNGIDPGDLEATRLVHFDPRRRFVVCATGLVGSTETLLGIGAIALDGHEVTDPGLLVVGERHRAELRHLLTRALVGTASARGRSRAA